MAPLTQVSTAPIVSVLDGDVESWGTKGPVWCTSLGMCASKENILLHCYLGGIIQALLSACWGAVTAEITCFHKAPLALCRESLALNPVHCLVFYSLFYYTQSQVSTDLWLKQFHFADQWDTTTREEESFLRSCVA